MTNEHVPTSGDPQAPAEPGRIGFFRALMLGDMLCAAPLLAAVRARWPRAELVLIGLPWARDWALRYGADRFVAFPGWPGLPERVPDLPAWPHFLQSMQAERFDLLVQAHGSGRLTNPLMAAFAARWWTGFVEADDAAVRPDLPVPWPEHGSERERLLALADRLGIARPAADPPLPLREAEREAAARLTGGAPYACLHVGARFASRRWPADRFAAVAQRLAQQGLAIVLTGSAGEQPLVDAVKAGLAAPAIDLCGRTDLWLLAAVIAGARVLVCNDTGVSHVAVATGTPSVVVSCGADVARWAPDDAGRHAVAWRDAPCRPCMHERCPYEHPCATGVTVDEVVALAIRQAMDHPAAAIVAAGADG